MKLHSEQRQNKKENHMRKTVQCAIQSTNSMIPGLTKYMMTFSGQAAEVANSVCCLCHWKLKREALPEKVVVGEL